MHTEGFQGWRRTYVQGQGSYAATSAETLLRVLHYLYIRKIKAKVSLAYPAHGTMAHRQAKKALPLRELRAFTCALLGHITRYVNFPLLPFLFHL